MCAALKGTELNMQPAVIKGTELNMQPAVIKGIVHQKCNFCHYLLPHMLSQTCINFFLVLNTK